MTRPIGHPTHDHAPAASAARPVIRPRRSVSSKGDQAPMMSPFQPLSLTDRPAGGYPAVAAPRAARPFVAATGTATATPGPRSPVTTPVRPVARATVARRDIRATIAALPGRGEDPAVFDALADRLALDGYLLTVVPDGGNRVSALVEGRVPGAPFVLLGSEPARWRRWQWSVRPPSVPTGWSCSACRC
uniref:Uncharacterized protein n=1 Tax=Frankia alni (strain DSM 45986 / CECT 9034 / ACN14a) TaxID=326424 RepID=Q70Z01_FRAAA|nr:hypothetical protein [Frankia alni ACN14a]